MNPYTMAEANGDIKTIQRKISLKSKLKIHKEIDYEDVKFTNLPYIILHKWIDF